MLVSLSHKSAVVWFGLGIFRVGLPWRCLEVFGGGEVESEGREGLGVEREGVSTLKVEIELESDMNIEYQRSRCEVQIDREGEADLEVEMEMQTLKGGDGRLRSRWGVGDRTM